MQDCEAEYSFDVAIDQLSKLLWVLKDGPATRDAAAMYEKVLRDEWEKARRMTEELPAGHDDIPELPPGSLDDLVTTMDEIQAFVIRSVQAL